VCNVQDEPGPTRVQLCGTFAVELSGRRVDEAFPGRQTQLLFSYLVLFRPSEFHATVSLTPCGATTRPPPRSMP
jgi:hypothetical protein